MPTKLADLTRTLNLTFGPAPRAPRWPGRRYRRGLPRLVLMTDADRLADPLAVLAALPAGSAVILRHYKAPGRAALAVRLVAAARRRGVAVLIAGDAALAARSGADGVHLPGHLLGRRAAMARFRRPGFVVTAAVHDVRQMRRALLAGADAVLVSPVFPTASHPGRRPLGVAGLQRLARAAPLPVLALGGVGRTNLARLRASAAAGCAAIGLLADAVARDTAL